MKILLTFLIQVIATTEGPFIIKSRSGFECSFPGNKEIYTRLGVGTDPKDVYLSMNMIRVISEKGYNAKLETIKSLGCLNVGYDSLIFESNCPIKELLNHPLYFQLLEKVNHDLTVLIASKSILLTTLANGEIIFDDESLLLTTSMVFKQSYLRIFSLLSATHTKTKKWDFLDVVIRRSIELNKDGYDKAAIFILCGFKKIATEQTAINLLNFLKHQMMFYYLTIFHPNVAIKNGKELSNPFVFLSNTNFSMFCDVLWSRITQVLLDKKFITEESIQRLTESMMADEDSKKMVLSRKIILSSKYLMDCEAEDIKLIFQRNESILEHTFKFTIRGISLILSCDDLKSTKGLKVQIWVKNEHYSNLVDLSDL